MLTCYGEFLIFIYTKDVSDAYVNEFGKADKGENMRKFKKLLIVTVLALTLIFVLTGCAPTPNTEKPGGDIPPPDEVFKVTENTDPETIVSQKLTNEKWKVALDKTKYVNFSTKASLDSNGNIVSTNMKATATILYTKATMTTTDGTVKSEDYNVLDGNINSVYTLNLDTNVWSKRDGGASLYNGFTDYILFADFYSSFTYSAEKNAYLATDISVTMDASITKLTNVTLKFLDDKLSYMYIYVSIPLGVQSIDLTIEAMLFDIGTTTVTLPTVA